MEAGSAIEAKDHLREPFMQGYLHDRCEAGFRPPSDYPQTRLPDAGDHRMQLRTIFPGLDRTTGAPAKAR